MRHHVRIKVKTDEEGNPIGPHRVPMKLLPLIGGLGELLRAAYEIEMLRGTRRQLQDGSTLHCFELDDEKGRALRQALTLLCYPLQEN